MMPIMKRETSKRANEQRASAPGKIILSGEYAVLFGHRGIAVPSKESITVTWADDTSFPKPIIIWESGVDEKWIEYTEQIFNLLQPHTGTLKGTLFVQCGLPLGKGMGSSTALVIAISRCLLGNTCEKIALSLEDQMSLGHSGIDFAVIWKNAPILYSSGKEPEVIDLPNDLLKGAKLIDTGKPNETTKELVAWMKEAVDKKNTFTEAIETIGNCTERLLKGESLRTVMRDHHRAQIALGIVPETTQQIIAQIELEGGSAKVIGAGGRTGGGGMVLVLPPQAE